MDKWLSATLVTVMWVLALHWRRTWWQCHYHDPKVQQQPWRVMQVNSVWFSACHLSPLRWHRPALWTMMMESLCGSTWWMSRLDCTVSKDFKRKSFWRPPLLYIRKNNEESHRHCFLLKSFDMKCNGIFQVNTDSQESAETAPWQH